MSLEGQPRNDAMSACGAKPHQRVRVRRDGPCKPPAIEATESWQGALKSIYLALRYLTPFVSLTLVSPYVWWNRNSILHFVGRRATGGMQRAPILPGLGGGGGERVVHEAELLGPWLKEMAGGHLHRYILSARPVLSPRGERCGREVRFLSPA